MIWRFRLTLIAAHRWLQVDCFKRVCVAVGTLLLCVAATSAAAQEAMPRGVGGPAGGMATRSVSKYLDLERALQAGIARRERAAVLQVLGAGFEIRTAASPDAIAVDEWLQRALVQRAGVVRGYAFPDDLKKRYARCGRSSTYQPQACG